MEKTLNLGLIVQDSSNIGSGRYSSCQTGLDLTICYKECVAKNFKHKI